jgi:hypothetical protein
VRFDQKPAFSVRYGKHNDTALLFFHDEARLLREIKAAKKMMFEVTLFHNGTRHFEFDVTGLASDWAEKR